MAVHGQARVGIGRVGAFRVGYFDALVRVDVNGVDRGGTILKSSLTINDRYGPAPNTAKFATGITPGWVPLRGATVEISIGARNKRVFAGQIVDVDQVYRGKDANIAYAISCTDYTRLLNRLKVWKIYTAQTGDAIVNDLIATYTSGFTTTKVMKNLGVVDSLVLTGVDVSSAIDQVAKALGVVWYVDYTRDVHLEPTANQSVPGPNALTNPLTTYEFKHAVGMSQARTRVFVRGFRSRVPRPVAAGATTIPVDDIAPFLGGALAEVNGQRIAYTGTSTTTDDSAAAVAGLLASLAAPTPSVGRSTSTQAVSSLTRSGSTVTVTTSVAHNVSQDLDVKIAGAAQNDYNGTFRVARVTGPTTFEYVVPGSPTSPATGTITMQKVSGGDVDPGSHSYRVSAVVQRVTGDGRTLNEESEVGTASAGVTAASLDPPAALTALVAHSSTSFSAGITRSGTVATVTTASAHSFAQGMSVTISGANESPYNGVFTIIRVTGATTFEVRVAGSPASPATGTIVVVARTAGPLIGVFKYRYTFESARGETLGSAETSVTATEIVNDGSVVATPSTTVDGGLPAGTYQYRTTYVSAAGETRLGGTSSGTISQVSAPGSGPSLAASAVDGGLAPGAYNYRVTYVTAQGRETDLGGNANVTVNAVSAPGGPTATVSTTVDGGLAPGAYGYVVTYVTAKGETAGGTAASPTVNAVTAPGAPSGSATTGGSMTPSTAYYYRVTFVTAGGRETEGGTISSAVNLGATDNGVNLTSIPTSADGRVTQRKIYRRKTLTGTFYLVGTINDNSATTFGDGASDQGLSTVAPTVNTTGGQIALTSIPTSADARVIKRRLYRKKPSLGDGVYYFLHEINDNTTTNYTDAAPDNVLGAAVPTINTTGGQVALTNIPTSGDGRVTGRRIYRQKAGGSGPYFLVHSFSDNVTTTHTDTAPDSSLSDVAPSANTTAGQMNLSSLVTSVDPRCIARRIYRTKAGGSTFYLLTTINDNTTTTPPADVTTDAGLSETAPAEAQNNGASVKLLGVLTSSDPRVTTRRIYRTVAGGNEFRLVGAIGDNTTTTYTDAMPDESLGGTQPATNTFGGDAIVLLAVPLGPSGTIARNLYRTEAAGSVYKRVGSIGDNTTTTYTDRKSDKDLGQGADVTAVSLRGTPAGSTTLPVTDLAKFAAAGGWVFVNGHPIRYTGRSGTSGPGTLTGIPTSGTGAILVDIPAGTAVVNEGYLTGVTGVTDEIPAGTNIRVLVKREDAAAAAALALLEGGDGWHEHTTDAGDMASVAQCADVADAELELFKDGDEAVHWWSHDHLTASARQLTVNLGAPTSVAGTFTIQDVTIDGFELTRRGDNTWEFPRYHGIASNAHFTLEDLLRLVEIGR